MTKSATKSLEEENSEKYKIQLQAVSILAWRIHHMRARIRVHIEFSLQKMCEALLALSLSAPVPLVLVNRIALDFLDLEFYHYQIGIRLITSDYYTFTYAWLTLGACEFECKTQESASFVVEAIHCAAPHKR